jgi:hypothetical protein
VPFFFILFVGGRIGWQKRGEWRHRGWGKESGAKGALEKEKVETILDFANCLT